MKIAIPLTANQISAHFGHCEAFAIFEIKDGKIVGKENLDPPAHEPGSHPRFLHEQGVNVVIAGGMGMRAQELMQESGITVVIGANPAPLEELVNLYLEGKLEAGENRCDH